MASSVTGSRIARGCVEPGALVVGRRRNIMREDIERERDSWQKKRYNAKRDSER